LCLFWRWLAPLLTRIPRLQQALALLGSLYMLYLAYKLARASAAHLDGCPNAGPPGIFSGVAAQYTNPKAWIVAVSAISIYVATGRRYGALLLAFCAIFLVLCFPSLLAWSVAGASLARWLGGIRAFNLAMALLLVLSVASFLIEFFF
jgi:threonine/homoserine/homoserine lactone efflux protein